MFKATFNDGISGEEWDWFNTSDEAMAWLNGKFGGADEIISESGSEDGRFNRVAEWENFDGETFQMTGNIEPIALSNSGWQEMTNERGEKVMVNPHGKQLDFEAALMNMDDDLREELHMALAPCSEAEFFAAYADAHRERFGEEWELAKDNPVW
ncbi:MAG: hypothetical protein GX484_05330 [Chloroflexi bacterium]|nr:hypothetical protein [Chloroflexota bacterium]